MIRTTVSAFVLVASLAAVSSVAAQEVRQARVPYGDLNLARSEGRDRLARRVEAAVRQVCGDARAVDLVESALQRDCRQVARESARTQVRQVIAAANTPTQLASR